MSAEENKEIVRRFFKDFESTLTAPEAGDMQAAMANVFADDGTWWVSGNNCASGTFSKAEFLEYMDWYRATFPNGYRITEQGITAEGDRVAFEIETYAEHKSGKFYHNFYHFLIVLRDGKIQLVKSYMDTEHVAEIFCG